MRLANLALILAVAGALAACNRPGELAGGPEGFGGPVGAGAGTYLPGSASDPTSPAYFTTQVGDRVLFVVDTSTLTDEARGILSNQARWLQQNTGYTAVIEGHADEQGTREYNLALGARRAAAAQEFLVAQGVPPARLRTVSYGKERPLAVCSEESCYAQNRRAVTVLALGAGV